MPRVILLDAGPLGLITNPGGGDDATACKRWFERTLNEGTRVCVPAIADYEVRRELIRAKKHKGLQRLDELVRKLGYIPLVEEAMRTAAEIWADARLKGRPTAPAKSLDADCLLAAQARTLPALNRLYGWVPFTREEWRQVIKVAIATTNVGHLKKYADVIGVPPA
jgi:predicted nucleic acid-binding protein